MMTRTDMLRRWAAAQLGLPPDVSADEMRSELLKRLPGASFLPPETWHSVGRALAGTVDDTAILSAESTARAEVETFARQFWDLSPGERRRRWVELSRDCSWALALTARLQRLERGLDLDTATPQAELDIAELIEAIRHQFTQPVLERARARQCLWQRIGDQLAAWREAASRLRRDFPQVAALDPDLMTALGQPLPGPDSAASALTTSTVRAGEPADEAKPLSPILQMAMAFAIFSPFVCGGVALTVTYPIIAAVVLPLLGILITHRIVRRRRQWYAPKRPS